MKHDGVENRRRAEKEHADDLDKLKAKVFGELEGQGEEKARENITSLARVMISKYIRLLDISDNLVKQTRTLDILLDLIRYNKALTVVTVSAHLLHRGLSKLLFRCPT